MSDDSGAVKLAASIWATMQRDPMMVTGLTMGELEDLMAGVSELVTHNDSVRRAIPIVLMLDLGASSSDVAKTMQNVQALLKLAPIRAELDKRAP
jgi:hypothetical protein